MRSYKFNRATAERLGDEYYTMTFYLGEKMVYKCCYSVLEFNEIMNNHGKMIEVA